MPVISAVLSSIARPGPVADLIIDLSPGKDRKDRGAADDIAQQDRE